MTIDEETTIDNAIDFVADICRQMTTIKEYMNIGDTEYATAAIMSLITVYGGRQ